MSNNLKVYIADGGRHRQPTGYGKNARSLARILSSDLGFEIVLQKANNAWEIDDLTRVRLGKVEEADIAEAKNFDCVLQVGQPLSCKSFPVPSAIFTCCDTTDLPISYIQQMRGADAVIAPNRGNYDIYRKHFEKVYLAQQGIDEAPFKPRKNYRNEGAPEFSFIFVGSFSFRKGVDLLVRGFIEEFNHKEANLYLHLPGEQADRAANYIFEQMKSANKLANFKISTNNMSEAWMARSYNRCDCFVTCTRGEGWGLPIVEAMLCGLPVISPFSTAMADYLNNDVALPVHSTYKKVIDITDPFGLNFKSVYGSGDIGYYEVDVLELRKQMRFAFNNREFLTQLGASARTHILTNFTERKFGLSVGAALIDLVSSRK